MNSLGVRTRITTLGIAVQKTSLIDFPGRVSAVLFLPGCNFRCPYCHNPELVLPPFTEELVPVGEALDFLDTRRKVLSGVVLSGGEPLLREDLADLASAVRGRGFRVKLDTNGSFPERIAALGADFIALDIKTAPECYGRVAPEIPDAGSRILESIRVVRSLGVPYEFRITCAPDIVGTGEIHRIAEVLEPEDSVVLQGFRPQRVLGPRWADKPPTPETSLREYKEILSSRAALVRVRSSV